MQVLPDLHHRSIDFASRFAPPPACISYLQTSSSLVCWKVSFCLLSLPYNCYPVIAFVLQGWGLHSRGCLHAEVLGNHYDHVWLWAPQQQHPCPQWEVDLVLAWPCCLAMHYKQSFSTSRSRKSVLDVSVVKRQRVPFPFQPELDLAQLITSPVLNLYNSCT